MPESFAGRVMEYGRNDVHAALLALLRAGVWERDVDELSLFPLRAENWTEVFYLARRQTVTGIVFHGLNYLPEDLLPPAALLARWVAVVDAIERKNREMDAAVAGLHAMFGAQGLEPVLLKGQGVAVLYPNPLLRECGDIDFYFPRKEEGEAALSCVREKGGRVEKMPDGSSSYLYKGIEVEQHERMFDLRNPSLKRRLEALEAESGWCRTALPSVDVEVAVPSPSLNLLLLDTHILKHALGWGIGLRQLCDMAMACRKWCGEVDAVSMKRVFRSMGLDRWNRLLSAFLVDSLGMPSGCFPFSEERDASSRPLLDIVWKGGNFGLYAEGRNVSGRPAWMRKLHTSRSFLHNVGFSYRYAPKEAFWIVADLLKGQFR